MPVALAVFLASSIIIAAVLAVMTIKKHDHEVPTEPVHIRPEFGEAKFEATPGGHNRGMLHSSAMGLRTKRSMLDEDDQNSRSHGNMSGYDSRLTAYWDVSNCGPAGNDANNEWCGGLLHRPKCKEEVDVDFSICESGHAILVHFKHGSVWGSLVTYHSGCIFIYFAQYECKPTTTTTTTVTTTTTSTSTSSTQTTTTTSTTTPTTTTTTSLTTTSTTFTTTRQCHSGFRLPPAPKHAPDHNGIRLPDVCYPGEGPHKVFIVGDWGGIVGTDGPHPAHERLDSLIVESIDKNPQQRVAGQMINHSSIHPPDYILNVGDSFYWGGLDFHCGTPADQIMYSDQLKWNFEAVYKGGGLDDKPWLGVLGNHDYGGYLFTKGWDQLISYTWGPEGRWLIPAQYWRSTVRYSDFLVDYFFLDTNIFNALAPTADPAHNVCSLEHNEKSATCGAEGPSSVYDCPNWFQKLWEGQQRWLEDGLTNSYADWQIIITHFPPTWSQEIWGSLATKHGIDLFVSGHVHRQEIHYGAGNFMEPTAWIVSGGGGGITSEDPPDVHGNDDQYGFFELSLSKHIIKVTAISHAGVIRSTTEVKPRHRVGYRRTTTTKPASKAKPAPKTEPAQGEPTQQIERQLANNTTTEFVFKRL